MNITREQIIEGRDEALDHLGIDVADWETITHDKRMKRMRLVAAKTPLSKAAALTVAQAERELCDGVDGIPWLFTAISIGLTSTLRTSDVALVA